MPMLLNVNFTEFCCPVGVEVDPFDDLQDPFFRDAVRLDEGVDGVICPPLQAFGVTGELVEGDCQCGGADTCSDGNGEIPSQSLAQRFACKAVRPRHDVLRYGCQTEGGSVTVKPIRDKDCVAGGLTDPRRWYVIGHHRDSVNVTVWVASRHLRMSLPKTIVLKVDCIWVGTGKWRIITWKVRIRR